MDLMSIILLILLLLFAYPLIIYPLILAVLPQNKVNERNLGLDSVSILISAYNESELIQECVESVLNSDLNGINLEILVGSDGSDDDTVGVVKNLEDKRIRVLDFERAGKNTTINKLVDEAKYDTLLFIDADFRLKSDTITKLLAQYSRLDVGVIICPIEVQSAESESIYQKYESFIRKKESEISSCVNTLGGYIINKSIFEKIDSTNYCDDLFSILTSIDKGERVYFDTSNSIYEVRESNFIEDFGRRKRLVGGGLSTIFRFKNLLSPTQGWNSFFLWSHKVLRWYSSIFFFASYIFSFFLINTLFGLLTAYLITLLLIISAIGYLLETGKMKNPFKLPLFFVSMNVGFIQGIYHFYKGKQNSVWGRKGLE